MTYYTAKDLAESFRTVRKNTVQVAEEIPEEQYGYRAAPDTRTVSQMLVHLALALQMFEQIHAVEKRKDLAGFDFMGWMQRSKAEEEKPRAKAEIVAMLRDGGERWAKWLEGVSEETLAERVAMPPGMTPASKARFEMLLSGKEHEMHHRAQLMLIERMLGITPHLTRDFQARLQEMRAKAQA
jgi:uncharacterized damage-inducible protein DinB